MPRLMSFAKTTQQIRDKTKTVTRRIGWRFAKVGDVYDAIDRSPRSGNGYETLGQIRVVDVRREPLSLVSEPGELAKEGLPSLTAEEFIDLFPRKPWDRITRIEFEYLEDS